MLREDPQLQLWLAGTGLARERRSPRIWVDRHASESPTLRQRAGQAVIAAGEWLAGGQAPVTNRRPLTARPS